MYHFVSEKFKTTLFCDEDGIPIILPCIFSLSLSKNRLSYQLSYVSPRDRISKVELKPKRISLSIVGEVLNELRNYLQFLEVYSVDKKSISLSTHHNLPDDIINYYLNDYLVGILGKSEPMVKKSHMTLSIYYNYLAYHGFTNVKTLNLSTKYLSLARENTRSRNIVKYFSNQLRSAIYANSNSLRDECILRLGGTCGLRAKENIGILLEDFKIGKKTYKGIESLIKEMKDDSNKDEFDYYLQGKYSKSVRHKGGKSRHIYIPKETLICFERYIEEERPKCTIDNLFVTEPSSGYLKPISKDVVTIAFKLAREAILEKQEKQLFPNEMDVLDTEHSYHILRHSFGTDVFHDAVKENGLALDSVTVDSLPYLITARLLGHSTKDKRHASSTTKTYIHTCHSKVLLEEQI